MLGLFGQIALTLSSYVIPFTLGMAILRYRLWDIDLVIRRTLQYGVLTAIPRDGVLWWGDAYACHFYRRSGVNVNARSRDQHP